MHREPGADAAGRLGHPRRFFSVRATDRPWSVAFCGAGLGSPPSRRPSRSPRPRSASCHAASGRWPARSLPRRDEVDVAGRPVEPVNLDDADGSDDERRGPVTRTARGLSDQGQWQRTRGRCRRGYASTVGFTRRARHDRHEVRRWYGAVRRLHGPCRRRHDPFLHHDDRGDWRHAGRQANSAGLARP